MAPLGMSPYSLPGRLRRQPFITGGGILHQSGQRGRALVLDQVGQRAGRRGQRHRDDGTPQRVDLDAVHETQVDHVDAEFGVDDLVQRLAHVGRGRPPDLVDIGQRDAAVGCLLVLVLPALAGVLRSRRGIGVLLRTAVGESLGQRGVRHHAARRLFIAQRLLHGIEHRIAWLGHQIVVHSHSHFIISRDHCTWHESPLQDPASYISPAAACLTV